MVRKRSLCGFWAVFGLDDLVLIVFVIRVRGLKEIELDVLWARQNLLLEVRACMTVRCSVDGIGLPQNQAGTRASVNMSICFAGTELRFEALTQDSCKYFFCHPQLFRLLYSKTECRHSLSTVSREHTIFRNECGSLVHNLSDVMRWNNNTHCFGVSRKVL